MDLNEYQIKSAERAIYGNDMKIIYPALGLANEAGEVLGKIKKVLRDNKGVYTAELKEAIAFELGDTLWYCAVLARDIDYDLDTVAQMNVNKLEDRRKRNVIHGSGDNR